MQSDILFSIVSVIAGVVFTGFLLYAAYFSFLIVRVLTVPIYKSRALWTGLLAIGFIAFSIAIIIGAITSIFDPSLHDISVIVTYSVVMPIVLFILYAWIDRTISLAIRLDYLSRDPLHWKQIRPLYWASVAVQSIISYPMNLYPEVRIILDTWNLLFLVTIAYSTVTLLIAGLRTKDLTLRKHLKWFGYDLVTILLAGFVYLIPFPSLAYVSTLLLILISYCFYRMAKSLAPLNRLSPSELSAASSILPEK